MRLFLGLAALAAVNAQSTTVTYSSTSGAGSFATFPSIGTTALTQISVSSQTASQAAAGTNTPSTAAVTNNGNGIITLSPGGFINSGAFLNSNNYLIYAGWNVVAIQFNLVTNSYTGQLQYRWSPNYNNPALLFPSMGFSLQSYTCDDCSSSSGNSGSGSAVTCNTATGPGGPLVTGGNSPATGFRCSGLTRTYTLKNLVQSTLAVQQVNAFSVLLFDIQTQPAPDTSSYSFQIVRNANPIIVGDPQIVGMQGQDFQVHGMPDEIFNIVSYPSVQVNARFTYLESAECHDNFTACFAHPGTYISEEGIRIGKDKVRIQAGSFKKGLTVTVNGKKTTKNVDLKHGAVEIVNHRRVIVHSEVMKMSISNSDKFLNQELELADDKLIALGSSRVALKDNERFHPEVPLHGLQGQTWRNVEYSSGLEYEGSIMDYHVVDGNLFGTDFVFNQFTA